MPSRCMSHVHFENSCFHAYIVTGIYVSVQLCGNADTRTFASRGPFCTFSKLCTSFPIFTSIEDLTSRNIVMDVWQRCVLYLENWLSLHPSCCCKSSLGEQQIRKHEFEWTLKASMALFGFKQQDSWSPKMLMIDEGQQSCNSYSITLHLAT